MRASRTDVVGNFPLSVISPRLWVLEYSSKSVCHTWDVPGRINAAGLDIVCGCTCGRPQTRRTVFATEITWEICSENTFPARKHISFTFFNLQPRINKTITGANLVMDALVGRTAVASQQLYQDGRPGHPVQHTHCRGLHPHVHTAIKFLL